MDFLRPIPGFGATSFSIAIRNPKFEMKLWNYLEPLTLSSWIGISMLIAVSSLTLAIACKASLGNLKQGYDGYDLANSMNLALTK